MKSGVLINEVKVKKMFKLSHFYLISLTKFYIIQYLFFFNFYLTVIYQIFKNFNLPRLFLSICSTFGMCFNKLKIKIDISINYQIIILSKYIHFFYQFHIKIYLIIITYKNNFLETLTYINSMKMLNDYIPVSISTTSVTFSFATHSRFLPNLTMR